MAKDKKEAKGPVALKDRSRIFLVGAASALALVLVIVILIVCLVNAGNRRRQLESALTEAEQKLALREDAMSALEAQQRDQKTLIEELQGKLEDILNVQETEPVITSDQIMEQLGSLRELVTQRYIYTNAARRENSKTWLWDWTLPFSDSSLLVTYDGEIKAGIDFGAIQVDVDEDERAITVTLPPSKVMNNTIPQETINVLEVRDGLFNKITFSDYNEFIGTQKPVMEQKAVDMGLLTDADREAKAAIKALLELIPGMDTYTLVVR